MNENFKIYNGDCLKEHENIKTSSVDLILTDLPYGIMKGIDKYNHVFKKGKYDFKIKNFTTFYHSTIIF